MLATALRAASACNDAADREACGEFAATLCDLLDADADDVVATGVRAAMKQLAAPDIHLDASTLLERLEKIVGTAWPGHEAPANHTLGACTGGVAEVCGLLSILHHLGAGAVQDMHRMRTALEAVASACLANMIALPVSTNRQLLRMYPVRTAPGRSSIVVLMRI